MAPVPALLRARVEVRPAGRAREHFQPLGIRLFVFERTVSGVTFSPVFGTFCDFRGHLRGQKTRLASLVDKYTCNNNPEEVKQKTSQQSGLDSIDLV